MTNFREIINERADRHSLPDQTMIKRSFLQKTLLHPENQSVLQGGVSTFFEPLFYADFIGSKDSVQLLFGEVPDLIYLRAVDAVGMETMWTTTRWYKDIMSWANAAREAAAGPDKTVAAVSSTFGTRRPDGMLFVTTAVKQEAKHPAPESQTLPAVGPSQTPSQSKAKKRKKASRNHHPSSQTVPDPMEHPIQNTAQEQCAPPPPKRPRSMTSYTGQIGLDDDEELFMITSLSVEIKPPAYPMELLLSQGLAYLIGAYESCGSYTAMFIKGLDFGISYLVSPDVILFQRPTDNDGPDLSEPQTIDEFLNECKTLPHRFGKGLEPDETGMRVAWEVASTALDLVIGNEIGKPLHRIEKPSTELWALFTSIRLTEATDVRTRQRIVRNLRKEIDVYFKNKSVIDVNSGGGPGNGGEQGGPGGGWSGKSREDQGALRDKTHRSGSDSGAQSSAGGTAGSFLGVHGISGSRKDNDHDRVDDAGLLGSSIVEASGEGMEIGHLGLLPERSQQVVSAADKTNASFDTSSSSDVLPTVEAAHENERHKPVVSLVSDRSTRSDVDQATPYKWRSDDFILKDELLYPPDPEAVEDEQQEIDRAFAYRSNRAVLRKRAVMILQASKRLFEALRSEAQFFAAKQALQASQDAATMKLQQE
ncbi:hypothetical protein CI109_106673 [Kwoniella shandongensis]|uniref:Uncharacterized protein n=1 Tax=Kwoniella shandongensis TaxID=1734106 RepID=A0A5M6BSV0_9TREE|nr:uncharacterized protein CI109_006411 [Kwoniella shandongensis]KAA5525241.1 hypothetical protein CI109_006411 [Kwoniella shandongensis]